MDIPSTPGDPFSPRSEVGSEYVPGTPNIDSDFFGSQRVLRSEAPCKIRRTKAPPEWRVLKSLYDPLCQLYEVQPPHVENPIDPYRRGPPGHLDGEPSFFDTTGPPGRHLIQRKFPLIGVGATTLVFLLSKDRVAKMARFAAGLLAARHEEERSRDLGLSARYPTSYAHTEVIRAWTDPRHIHCMELTIQERLYGPFLSGGLNPKRLAEQPNCFMLLHMITNNDDVKQFAYTTEKEMDIITEEELEPWQEYKKETRRWLVGCDYR